MTTAAYFEGSTMPRGSEVMTEALKTRPEPSSLWTLAAAVVLVVMIPAAQCQGSEW